MLYLLHKYSGHIKMVSTLVVQKYKGVDECIKRKSPNMDQWNPGAFKHLPKNLETNTV